MSNHDNTDDVEYRGIPECEGYCFGSDGSVWSQWKRGSPEAGSQWSKLAQHRNPSGHLYLRVKINGKQTHSMGVHQLICWAFHGPCPEGMECCHDDGNPANNVPDNLYWGTRAQNIRDQIRHNVMRRGETSGMSKMNDDRVREMRRLYAAGGHTYRSLGAKFGLAHCTVKLIILRKTWQHVV
jgi:hypothetical protein